MVFHQLSGARSIGWLRALGVGAEKSAGAKQTKHR